VTVGASKVNEPTFVPTTAEIVIIMAGFVLYCCAGATHLTDVVDNQTPEAQCELTNLTDAEMSERPKLTP
jgi:hypothetical protein